MSRLEPAARERVIAAVAAFMSDRADVQFAFVFGSFMDGHAFRDIDLGVWTSASAGPRIEMELAAGLSRELGYSVDVRRINDAPVPFLFHVLRGRVIAVRDEALLANLMERTARDYHDRAPLLRRATVEAYAG